MSHLAHIIKDKILHKGNHDTPAASGTTSPATTTPADSRRESKDIRHSRQSLDQRPKGESPRSSISKDRHGSTSHNPLVALTQKLRGNSPSPSPASQEHTDARNEKKQHEQAEHEKKKERHDRIEADIARKKEEEELAALREDSREQRMRYGVLPVNNYAGQFKKTSRVKLIDIKKEHIGEEVSFRARIHTLRKMSAKMSFFVLRQEDTTIQGVLQVSEYVSKHMVYWAEHLPVESLMHIRGRVQEPKAKEGEIKSTIIHDKEIYITEFHLVAPLTENLPFTVEEAEVTEAQGKSTEDARQTVAQRARLQARILDLRTTTSHAIFQVQAAICRYFRSYLDSQGFMEIHTPKLQGGATESGASVFKVDYFGRNAFLAQSPQLAKQMSICADFPRVFEIGAVFRAENSNTHRHLTEFTGLDIEMAIDEHYWEVRNMIDRTLKSIFTNIYKNHKHAIEMVKHQFPHDDLVWLDETPIIPFKEAIQMLNDSGQRDDDGKPLPYDEDLGTRDEIRLGELMKEKYKTDYYIIDKFPASARPFYTMPDPNDPTYTNSFDIFVRGQEITSGGQRVHDARLLMQQMEKAKVDPKTMGDYMNGFEWGAPPHGGAGIGLERILMLLLKLGDVRHASMYPRDPRSLPARAKVTQLRHPEASTLHPPWEDTPREKTEMQPLEKLIANYGDASNTSWLEPKFKIWRDHETGAAMGYVPHQGFAIAVAEPLCHISQYYKIISRYLEYIKKETDLKPLWLLCGRETADTLGDRLDWRCFSCAAEQRVNLEQPLKAANDHDVQRKIRHANKEGLKISHIAMGDPVPKEFQQKIDKRVVDWLGNRKSHQNVHLTDVHPWQDMPHRQYYYATDKNGTICGLVILAILSPEHGWQVKFSLDFPDAPSGSIEALIMHALNDLKAAGVPTCTFGGGASNNFIPSHNMKGAKVKMLAKAYHTIATELKLTQKSEFRDKLGAEEDPIFVCYPPKGLGPRGVQAILSFFED